MGKFKNDYVKVIRDSVKQNPKISSFLMTLLNTEKVFFDTVQ